jgi:hypothetical protein
MQQRFPFELFVLSLALAACSGGTAPAETAASESPAGDGEAPAGDGEPASGSGDGAASTGAADSKSAAVPTQCAKSGSVCSPPVSFVKRLCNGNYPSIAVYMFGNKVWTKGYLTRRTQAWNAAGGASDNSWLEFDEEVLVLLERAADTGGMQVSGAGGGYEALRWDGSCVTLAKEEVTLSRPPSPKAAKVEWRYLDDNVQEALRADGKINDAFLERRKECKGATSGEVSLKCVKADAKLSNAVVDFVRSGGTVPEPTKLPE